MVKDLSYIVHQVMLDLEETGTSNYERYLQLAIFCVVNDIHMKYSEKLKVKYLTMSDIKTIDLPSDYLTYSKIAFCYRGFVVNLGLNNNLCLPRKKDECGNIEEVTRAIDCLSSGAQSSLDVNSIGHYGFIGHFRNGQYVGELYGMGGGFAQDYYRIDKDRQQIVLTGSVPNGEVLLEYKSSGIEPDGSMIVDQKILKAVRAYVHWQRIEYKPDVPEIEKERKKTQYEIELGQLADMEAGFTAQEYLDMHYRSTRLSPQR